MVVVAIMVIVVIVTVFFHPHVACGYTFFFSGMVGVFVSCGIVAVVAFMVIVFILFHPHKASCFAICFIVNVVVGMVTHVVADAVFVTMVIMVIAMVITVVITVLIAMVTVVVVCMTAKHLENCHCEILCMFCIEFNDVFPFFEVEDGNLCVSRTSCRVGDFVFSNKMVVAFMAVIMTVVVVVTLF